MFHSSLYWPHPHVPTGKPTSKPFIVHANIKSFDQPWNDQYLKHALWNHWISEKYEEIWREAASMQRNKWIQVVRPPDIPGKSNELSQAASGLVWSGAGGDGSSLGPLARRKKLQLNIGKSWQMHLFASPGHGPVTMLESSRNQTTSSCWHSACTLVHPRPAPSGVPTTSPATSPSTSAVPTAWHPA